MPKYTYQLTNGKTLELEGDIPPTDEEVESLAAEQNVQLALADTPPPDPIAAAKTTLAETAPVAPPITPEVKSPEVEQPGVLSRIWGRMSQPTTEAPSRFAESISKYINPESQTKGVRGIGSAFVESLGQTVSGLTSPIDLALAATTGGAYGAARAGLPKAASTLTKGVRALSGLEAAQGVQNVAQAESIPEALMGGVQAVGGGLGVRSRVPRIAGAMERPPVKIPDELPLRHRLAKETELPPEVTPEAIPESIPRTDDEITELIRQSGLEEAPPIEVVGEPQPFDPRTLRGLRETDVTTRHGTNMPRKEYPGFKGVIGEAGENLPPPSDISGGGIKPPGPPTKKLLGPEELDPKVPIQERNILEFTEPGKGQQAYDLVRGTMAVDLPFLTSAAFRQASPLAGTGKWFKAWRSAAKGFSDEAAYNTIMDKVEASKYKKPRFEPVYDKKTGELSSYREKPSIADEAGLKLTDLKGITNREDVLRGQLAERIPGYGRYVRASNRAYTAFLNDLRINKFEQMMDEAVQAGKGNDLVFQKEIADFVNAATGRGKLEIGVGTTGKRNIDLEQSSKLLTNSLFSPRLIAARMRFLNPATYVQASPEIRKEYIKGMARSMATWWGLAELAEYGAMASGLKGVSVNKDPTNADFGKIKIGNTRIDPGAGFQQYMVLAGRAGYAGRTSSTSNEFRPFGEGYKPDTLGSTTLDFALAKAHPTARLLVDVLNASRGGQRPFHVGDRTLQAMLPMFTQDMIEVFKEYPELTPPQLGAAIGGMGVAGSIGFGGQTYKAGEDFDAPVFTPALGLEEFDLSVGGR